MALLCVHQVKGQSIEEIEERIAVAKSLQHRDSDSCYRLAAQILSDSKQISYNKGVASACVRLASVLKLKGEYRSALPFLENAWDIRKEEQDWKGLAGVSFLFGTTYYELGNLDSTMIHFYEGIRFAEKSNDSNMMGHYLLRIAHSLLEYNQTEDAKRYFEQAYDLSSQMNDNALTAFCYSGLGNYYLHIGQPRDALQHFVLAAELFKSFGTTTYLAMMTNNIAVCYDQLGRQSKALSFYQTALEYYQLLRMPGEVAELHYNMGVLHYNTTHYARCVQHIDSALPFYLSSGDLQMQYECFEVLSDAYTALNQDAQALRFTRQMVELKDSLLNKEKINSISEVQTRYETEKKEQQIAFLDQENKIKTVQRKYLLMASVALMLALFILGFYSVQRVKLARKKEELAQQRIASLLDEQEIKTYNAMLEGQEEERMRISNDLHDRLGSMLSTIKLMFSALGDKIDRAQEESKMQYEKANVLLDDACVEVRRISHNLGAGMVANFGLIASLEELCESINQTGKLRCSLAVHNMDSALQLKTEIEIYRIVQEVLNNAIKHAKASNVSVQINRLDDEVNLHIEDDGVGFNVEEKMKSGGLGLSNVHNRAQKVGGQVHIDSYIGRGTTVILEIPLNDLL